MRAYGPTTPDHLQYWLGGGLSAGRRRILAWTASLGDRLAPVQVGGRDAVVLREDVEELATAEATDAVRLLPGHDQWVLGPGTADTDVVPPQRRVLATRGANLAVAGGVLAGTWTIRDDDLLVHWFEEAPRPSADAFDEGVARLSASVDRPLSATVRTSAP